MMAADREREAQPFGGYAGELAVPVEPAPKPLPPPLIPAPPWAAFVPEEDTMARPAPKGHRAKDRPC
jgi:hypothetical protein